MELIYEDLTHELIGCFFDVHNSLGVGYDEPAYHEALQRRFGKKGIEHRSEERKTLLHRARKVREFKADLITFVRSFGIEVLAVRFYQAQLRADHFGIKVVADAIGFAREFRLAKSRDRTHFIYRKGESNSRKN
jgi:GxxExxY protein